MTLLVEEGGHAARRQPVTLHDNYTVVERKLELNTRQLDLRVALHNRDPELAQWYVAALTVLGGDGPDPFALAAHEMREIFEKLYRTLPAPVAKKPDSLNARVKQLETQFERVISKTKCRVDGQWAGEIDEKLRLFLGEVARFFQVAREINPARRRRAAQMISGFDPHPVIRRPEDLVKREAATFLAHYEYFEQVSHHGSADDFEARMVEAESFLLELLYPRAFDHQDVIDNIIAEAENP